MLAVLAAVILVGLGTFSASVGANSLSGRSRNMLKLFGALFMSPILLIFYKLYHVLLPPLFRATTSVPRQPDQPGPR